MWIDQYTAINSTAGPYSTGHFWLDSPGKTPFRYDVFGYFSSS
jgi:hypothetical protein